VAPAILGKKIGMTRVYDADGRSVAVTVVQAGPCPVLQVKTAEKDGYHAVQLGYGEVKPARTPRPMLGHFLKAGVKPRRFIREIRLGQPTDRKPGDDVSVSVFSEAGVRWVDVVGTSRGFGYQGVMKRQGFKGQPASHGTERKHRSPGGIGAGSGDRGRGRSIKKGKPMAGQMGAAQRTTRNLRLVGVDAERNVLVIEGAVPGAAGGYVLVRQSKTRK
jgi:large subunit ribosomal protein L3